MPCCSAHHHCGWNPWPPELGGRRRRRWAWREDDAQDLEEEREMLEARLRRLERELEELRRAAPRPERP
jgi:hypothetical protein